MKFATVMSDTKIITVLSLVQVWSTYKGKDSCFYIEFCSKTLRLCKGQLYGDLLFFSICSVSSCKFIFRAINYSDKIYERGASSWSFIWNMKEFVKKVTWALFLQLMILSLLKGVGAAIIRVKELESFLCQLLRRRSQYYCEPGMSTQKLSNIEVEILCLLLEVRW